MQELLVLLGQLAQIFLATLLAEVVHHCTIRGVDQLNNGLAQRSLATARLANKTQRFTAIDVQINAVHCLNIICDFVEKSTANRKKRLDASQLKQNFLLFFAHIDTSLFCAGRFIRRCVYLF